MMKILVTGSSGYIGKHIVSKLKKQGDSVRG
jgi:nucleoside-diphosphate-sugar epimerase